MIPQHEARRLQLAAITGGSQEPAASFLELRYREPGGPMHQSFVPCRELATASARAAVLAQEQDVYVGMAPRAYRFGGRDAIERVWCLWVDLDRDDALERIAAFAPAPSLVTLSGTPGHVQATWALRRALRPDHAKVALRRLAHTLGADMAAAEPARILRPPGSLNHKHHPPVAVECVRLELDSYAAAEVVGHLPDPPAPVARLPSARPASTPPRGSDPLRAIPAAVYVAALTGRDPDRDHKLRCPFHAGGQERTPSFHAYPDERGWACFGGCEPLRGDRDHAGGDVYAFGGRLWGLDWRDRDEFLELRRRLATELLPHLREVAA